MNFTLESVKRRLKAETVRRVAAEMALRKSERHHSESLEQARSLQEQLRHLSHQILSVQEEERKRISRELHDEVVQTLTGINVQLSNLKASAAINSKDLQRRITSTQRLVEKSVAIVHRFARDLRPTLLDDLGLIPALDSFVKDFTRRTAIRVRFTAFPSAPIDRLENAKRTVFYRVAQEALTNVARHAQADLITVSVRTVDRAIVLEVVDDGQGFTPAAVLLAKPDNRLGVLGMRERVQMVGGEFTLKSIPGQGTTVRAEIPTGKVRGQRRPPQGRRR